MVLEMEERRSWCCVVRKRRRWNVTEAGYADGRVRRGGRVVRDVL